MRGAVALPERALGKTVVGAIAYGGDERATVGGTELLPWHQVDRFAWS